MFNKASQYTSEPESESETRSSESLVNSKDKKRKFEEKNEEMQVERVGRGSSLVNSPNESLFNLFNCGILYF